MLAAVLALVVAALPCSDAVVLLQPTMRTFGNAIKSFGVQGGVEQVTCVQIDPL